jgi:hypothetical protein
MIVTVLNYQTGETYFYKSPFHNYDCNNDSIQKWLYDEYGYRKNEISFMVTENLNYYIDPKISKTKINIINE